jgi:cytochrome c
MDDPKARNHRFGRRFLYDSKSAFRRSLSLAAVLIASIASIAPVHAATTASDQAPAFRVLIFLGMKGHVHNSYRFINRVWDTLAAHNNFAIDTSNNGAVFHPDSLKKYQAVVFNNNTHIGDALDAGQKAAFFTWARTHGFLGMHGTADADNSWPEFSAWMGGELSVHSGTDSATMNIDTGDFAKNHPIIKDQALPSKATFREEWYSFKLNPRTYPGMRVLYTVDEKTFKPGVVMGDHPIVWVKEQPEGGRMVYMGMGHEDNLFFEDRHLGYDFVGKIMLSSLKWAAGAIPGTAIPVAPKAPEAPRLKLSLSGPGRVSIELPGQGDFTLALSTLDGKRVGSRQGRGARIAEFGGIRPGMYVLEWTTAGRAVRSRIVVP